MSELIPTDPLVGDSLHVWVIDISGLIFANLPLQHLNPPDLKRISHFHYAADRIRFAVGRIVLYNLCAFYLSQNEEDIRLSFNQFGKPYLPDSALNFNVSHSGNRVVLAFCWENSVGVDVEEMVEQVDFHQVASRFFSPLEKNLMKDLSSAVLRQSFYRCWTRKESFCKALGLGVSAPLDQFSVEFREGNSAGLLELDKRLGNIKDWQLKNVPISENYVCAVAHHSSVEQVQNYALTMTSLISSLI